MFFGPKFAALTFSDNSLKLAVAKPASKKFKVSSLISKQLPSGTVVNGRIVNKEVFGEELKALYLENFDKIKTKNLIVGLPEQEVYVTAIRFSEKPKHLFEDLKARLTPLLPFDIQKTQVTYSEIEKNYYQIAAARTEELQTLSNLIEDAGFNLKALVPSVLLLPKLVGRQSFPYLIISSEENLIFVLVVNGAVIFTSTFTLKESLAQSEKNVVQIAEEIIEKEYNSINSQTLNKVFLHGSGTEFLKSFLSKLKLDSEVIFASDKTDSKSGAQANNFGRAITLSIFDNSILNFPKITSSKDVEVPQHYKKTERKLNPIYLFLPLLLIAAATIFIFWPNLKDFFFKDTTQPTNINSPVQSSPSASVEEKEEATPSSEKQATESAEPVLSRGEVSIRVLNGSGTPGTAGDARDYLVSKGYIVESVGNAESFDQETTSVQYKNSVKEISSLLTKDLEARYAINTGSTLSESEPFDILIIIGGD